MGNKNAPPPNANQVTTDDGHGKAGTVQGELDTIQGDLTGVHGSLTTLQNALTPLQASRLADPHFQDIFDTDQVPNPAGQTSDPHRLTFRLPNSDATVMSLGAAGQGDRIVEPGIRGRTDHHIHWEVGLATNTLVTMGHPMATRTPGPVIPSFDASVPTAIEGYAMFTEGDAWHDAKGHQYIVAREHEVVVRSHQGNATLQSDAERVIITGKKGASLNAAGNVNIGASGDIKPEDKRFRQKFEGLVGDLAGAKFNQHSMKVLDMATAVYSLVLSYRSSKKKALKAKKGWADVPANDKAKIAVDAAKLVSQVGRFASSWWKDGQNGTVSIGAETYAGMTGGIAASLYGGLSASMTSILSASVLGGTAGVKGLAWTSVWSGLGTSVKSRKDVSIESEAANTKVKAKVDVDVAAETGAVKVTGQTLAQLNANAGPATVYGSSQVYCGAGAGPGYGMGANDKGAFLGKFSAPTTFDKPGNVQEEGVYVYPNAAGVNLKSGKIKLTDSAFRAEGKTVEIKAASGEAKLDGNKVLIG